MSEPLVNVGAKLQLDGARTFIVQMNGAAEASKKTGNQLATLTKMAKNAIAGTGKLLARTAVKGVIGGAIGGIAGAFGVRAAVEAFSEFDQGIARLGTVLPQGANAMQMFGEANKRLSVETGKAIKEVNDATFQAVSAGAYKSEGQFKEFMGVVGKAAAAGFTDMETAVNGATTVLNAWGMDMSKVSEVTDRFFIANKLAKTSVGEISASIGAVAPSAKALGVSFDDVLATVVSLTNAGIGTAETMTSLKAVLTNVIRPTGDAADMAKELKLDFSSAALQSKGLAGFLTDLTAKTKGNVDAQVALFGSIEAFNAIARLTSEDGLKQFNGALGELKASAGETERQFAQVQRSTSFKLGQLKQGFNSLVISLGGGIAKGLGLADIENVPETVAKAGNTLETAAASFAGAFAKAFAPALDVAKMDWNKFAADIGATAASFATGIGSILSQIPMILEGLVKIMAIAREVMAAVTGQGGPMERAAKEAGPDSFFMSDEKALDIGAKELQKADPDNYGGVYGEFHARAAAAPLIDVTKKREYAAWQEKQAAKTAEKLAIAASAAGVGADTGIKAAEYKKKKKLTEFERTEAAYQELARGKGLNNDGTKPKVVVNNDLNVNIDGKKLQPKKKKGGGSGAGRGRGTGEVGTTLEATFLVWEDKIIAVNDEFNYATLGAQVGK